MKRILFFLIFIGLGSIANAQSQQIIDSIAEGLTAEDEYTISGSNNFLTDYEPVNTDGTVNVVVEIPTGTTAKWEVDKKDGKIKWEFKKGKPRIVKYLGYPGNYGMLPRTLLPKELGGDGDPLDVLVLGQYIPRGSVVKAKVLGVLKLLDGGEQDDKIIAVLNDSPLSKVNNIQELDSQFIGVTNIIKTWFESYKGPGELVSKGFSDYGQAMEIINASSKAYSK